MNLFGLTDTGKVRADNQDSYAIRMLDEDLAVAVVCDGMGGAQAGNVASAVAVEAFAAAVEEEWKQSPPRDGAQCGQLMRDACHRANQAVFGLSQTNPDYQGMGTTLVAVLLWGEEVTVVNVGDSRAYLLRRAASLEKRVNGLRCSGRPEEARPLDEIRLRLLQEAERGTGGNE